MGYCSWGGHATCKESICCSVMSDSVQPCGQRSLVGYCPWDSSGKNTGMGCHSLFQGIFLTQELNPGYTEVFLFGHRVGHDLVTKQ